MQEMKEQNEKTQRKREWLGKLSCRHQVSLGWAGDFWKPWLRSNFLPSSTICQIYYSPSDSFVENLCPQDAIAAFLQRAASVGKMVPSLCLQHESGQIIVQVQILLGAAQLLELLRGIS
jgi:hypothetical protein